MIHFKKQIIITALVLFSIYYGIFGPSTGCLGSLKNSKEQLKKLCGKSLNATSCGENIFKKKLYDDFKGDDKIYSHGYYNYLTTFVYLGNILSIPNYCQAVSYFSSTDRKIFIDKCEKILYIYFNTDSTISGDEVKDAFNFVFKYMYEESKPHFNDTVKKFFMDMETELEFREDIKSKYTWCEQNTYWSKEMENCKDQLEKLCRVHIDASECGIYMFKEKLYDDFKGDDKKYARGFYEYVRTAVDLEDIPTIPEYCKKASKKRSIKYKPQFIAACENILNKFFNIDTNILDISDNHKKKYFDFTFISLNQEMYKYDTVIVERYVEHMFKAVSFYNDTKNGEQWCKGQTRT